MVKVTHQVSSIDRVSRDEEADPRQNITAGIAGVLSSFPADKRPSAASRDTVASAVHLDNPLGMCIAMATVWTGASLRAIGNPDDSWDTEGEDVRDELEFLMSNRSQPAPTLLILSVSLPPLVLPCD